MAGVSLPVKVFCWLGWYDPTRRYGPTIGLRAVTEARAGARHGDAKGRDRAQRRVPAEAAQGHEDAHAGQEHQLPYEERRAGVALLVGGTVERRRAADGGRDVGAVERQAVVGAT